MTSWSKLIPPEAAQLPCNDLIHPWNSSCWGNIFNMIRLTWIGSSIFYTVHFLFQYLHKMAKDRQTSLKEFDSKNFFKQLLMAYFRGVILFATPMSAGSVAGICFFRKILGRFYSKTSLYIPSSIGALGIFGLEPKIRLLYSTFFTNFALTIFTRKLQQEGVFKLSLLQKTSAFVALSAAISGILKRLSSEGKAKIYYWFFNPIPQKPLSEHPDCYHEHDCQSFILKDFFKYFTSGVLLSLVKIIFKLGLFTFTKPQMLVTYCLKIRFWRFPAFLGLYSLIFQGLRCTLRQVFGKSTVLHNVLAGGVAGFAFPLHPSMTLLNTAVITLAQILTRLGSLNKSVPDLPYAELFFAASTGYLYESAVLTPKLVPNLALYILRTATSGRITEHHKNILGKYEGLQIYSDLPLIVK